MDQQSYAAAQQGFLQCILDDDHEERLQAFLAGLRDDPPVGQRANRRDRGQASRDAWRIPSGAPCDAQRGDVLSERETTVLQLIAQGHTNKDVAAMFDLSAKTVETYKTRALVKLGLATRVDIVKYARQRGWI